MAERKPLISPAAAMPSSTLSRIVQRDRQESGRETVRDHEFEEAETAKVAEEEVRQTNNVGNMASHTATNMAGKQVKVVSLKDGEATNRESGSSASKRERRKQIEDLADTPLVNITLRIPEGVNDWLATYVHNHRKQNLKKQAVVLEALILLMLQKDSEE